MKQFKLAGLTVLASFLLITAPGPVTALSLRGHFPLHQGNFWNFETGAKNQLATWAVNGTLNLRDAGPVILLMAEKGHVLCLKEDWDGIYLYAEYWPDRFHIPEAPVLFMPHEMTEKQPVTSTTAIKIFTDPDGYAVFKQTGRAVQETTLTLMRLEPFSLGTETFVNCAVIEKKTAVDGRTATEKIWLAPSVGPVKRVVTENGRQTVYRLTSYTRSSFPDTAYALKAYLPMAPGTIRTYRNRSGKTAEIKTLKKEKGKISTDTEVVPVADPSGDIHYYTLDDRGLVLIQKYWSAYGGLTAYPPPRKPVIVLPPELYPGRYHCAISFPSSYRFRSLTEHFGNYPELAYSGIVTAVEDVTVPSGTYRNCLKIALCFISRNFQIRFEVLRSGYIWLARGQGIVKEEAINLYNYFLPGQVNSVFDIRFWELAGKDQQK